MDKIAYYKEEIYKTAARAWKKHLGDIGEDGVNKLIGSGIFNRGKELQGLKKGTNKILGKNNAKMFRDPDKPAALMTRGFRSSYEDKSKFGFKMNSDEISSMMKSLKDSGPAFGDSKLSKSTGLLDGLTMVNKNQNKQMQILSDGELPKIPRKDRESKKWLQAIIERHEADEIRFGSKILKNKKKMAQPGLFDVSPKEMTRFYSHASPKVVAAESANAALAPKNARGLLARTRNYSFDPATRKGSEVLDLKDSSGIIYGKSGVYNRAAANKAEREVIKNYKKNNSFWKL